MEQKKGKKQYPPYELNPSIVLMNGMVEEDSKFNRTVSGGKDKEKDIEQEVLIVDKGTGEQMDGVMTRTVETKPIPNIPFIYDTLTYEKTFAAFDFSKLSHSAFCVLQYIREHLKPKQHSVFIYPKECMGRFGWKSRTNFYKAIANLLENEVLYVKANSENEYFLNVNKFFNGDRVFHYRKTVQQMNKSADMRLLVESTKKIYLATKQKNG